MRTLRLFAALEPPPDVRDRLASALQEASVASPAVRWVAPPHLHLTLKFFGELSDERMPLVTDLLAKVAGRHGAFELALEGLGGFPDLAHPKVLWVQAGPSEGPLRELAADVEKNAGLLGLGHPEKIYRAHVTLGRLKDPREGAAAQALLGPRLAAPLGPWRVNSFFLYQSLLTEKAPIYAQLREFALTG